MFDGLHNLAAWFNGSLATIVISFLSSVLLFKRAELFMNFIIDGLELAPAMFNGCLSPACSVVLYPAERDE